MEGSVLLNAFRSRLATKLLAPTVNDTTLASALNISVPTLKRYLAKTLTANDVMTLMDRAARKAEQDLIELTCVPIVEFFPLEPVLSAQGAKLELFETGNHSYRDGLFQRLNEACGVYVFYDSRGNAIYVGKAAKTKLWAEMKDVFNRDRKDIQRVRRVDHPTSKVAYKSGEERLRPIRWENVALHDIACYVSAYSVPSALISKMEALLMRAFANDLLNAKMESP